MFRTLATILAILPLTAPLAAQTDYTWSPAATGANPWDTTATVWSTDGAGGPFDKVFANGATNNAVLTLASGTANLTAGTAINFGQLRIGSDGFTLTSGTAANNFTFNQGFRTVGGARSLNLTVGATATSSFVAGGTGDTTAGKLTLTVGGLSQFGLRINSGTALGTNTDLIATGTTGGSGVIGTRILLTNDISVHSGVTLHLQSNSAGNLQSTLMGSGGTSIWNGGVNLVGDGTANIDAGPSNNLEITGNVTSTAAGQMRLWGTGTGTISGPVGGATGLTKTQGGAWHLENLNSSYTGATAVQGGTLFVYKLANAGVGSSLGAATGANAAIRLGNPGGSDNATLSYNWANASSGTNRAIELVGSGGTSTITASTLSNVFLTLDGDITSTGGSKTLTLAGGNSLSGGTVNGVISGSGGAAVSVSKTGSSIWTLTGNNTYSGTTSVSGRLVINGNQSAATGAVSVTGSGVLGGTGTVGGATTVSVGGLIRGDIGTGGGTLTVANAVTIQGGGTTFAGGGIAAAVSDTGVNSATASLLNLTGAGDRLTFALGSLRFRIRLEQGAVPITTDGSESYTITLARVAAAGNIWIDATSLPADTVIPASQYELSATGFGIQSGSVLRVDNTGRNLVLNFTPVPEPATVGLTAAGGGLLLAALRRTRRRHTIPG